MMKTRPFLLLALVFATLLSCKKDHVNGDASQTGGIEQSNLIGAFEISAPEELSGNTNAAIQNGALWAISKDSIRINCNDGNLYSFKEDVILLGEQRYSLKEKAKGSEYDLLYKQDGKEYNLSLKKSDRTCAGEGPVSTGTAELDKLYGYGEGTTGGEGATAANIHHFDNGDKFREWLGVREKKKSKEPAIVWLSGTFTKENGRAAGSPWFDIKDTENISIYGTNGFKMQNVGFFLARAENIIIRNIYIVMPKADNGADGLSMQKSNRVWVDHCSFESVVSTLDYEDGSCDVTHGTTNVTISWNHFMRTQKTSLVGHSDSETGDVAITATFHHNFFDQSSSRHPRVRYGTVHVYNNFFNAVSTYGVGSAMGAKVLVEANNFDSVRLPTDICTFPAKKSGSSWVSNLTGKAAGFLFARGNAYLNKPENASDPYPFTNTLYVAYDGEKLPKELTSADFIPSYTYVMDKAEDIKTIVPAGAGTNKLPGFDKAPVAVNNGNIADADPPVTEPGDGGNNGGGDQSGTVIGKGWYSFNNGDSQGSHILNANKTIQVNAKGKLEGENQSFYFIYREVTGDFEMTVRLDSYASQGASSQAIAGLMLSTTFDGSGTEFLHALSAKGGKTAEEFNYSQRLVSGNANRGVLGAPESSGGATYLKLKRAADTYYASYSLDGGVTYGKERSGKFSSLPDKLYIGLAVNSGSNSASSTAVFGDIKVNGQTVAFE